MIYPFENGQVLLEVVESCASAPRTTTTKDLLIQIEHHTRLWRPTRIGDGCPTGLSTHHFSWVDTLEADMVAKLGRGNVNPVKRYDGDLRT